jgi:hypothetical protein
MEKFIRKDPDLLKLFSKAKSEWILAPNAESQNPTRHSTASVHGAFDDDTPTVRATLQRILGASSPTDAAADIPFEHTASSLKDTRVQLARSGASQAS